MTFWEQYNLYLKDNWLSAFTMWAALSLLPVVIKYLTGTHHLLDKFVTDATLPFYALGLFMGLFIAVPLIAAIHVYLMRK